MANLRGSLPSMDEHADALHPAPANPPIPTPNPAKPAMSFSGGKPMSAPTTAETTRQQIGKAEEFLDKYNPVKNVGRIVKGLGGR